MPSLQRSKKKNKKSVASSNGDTVYPVTHIVTPARALRDAIASGEPAQARCGATISQDRDPAAGICADCMDAQFKADDTASDERAQERYDAGKAAGVTEGRRNAEREAATARQTFAREAQEAQRVDAQRPRFEDNGRTLKFTYLDGRVDTVRKNRIRSVRFAPTDDGQYALLVDDVVLVKHADQQIVRGHHDQLHQVVFGEAPTP